MTPSPLQGGAGSRNRFLKDQLARGDRLGEGSLPHLYIGKPFAEAEIASTSRAIQRCARKLVLSREFATFRARAQNASYVPSWLGR